MLGLAGPSEAQQVSYTMYHVLCKLNTKICIYIDMYMYIHGNTAKHKVYGLWYLKYSSLTAAQLIPHAALVFPRRRGLEACKCQFGATVGFPHRAPVP